MIQQPVNGMQPQTNLETPPFNMLKAHSQQVAMAVQAKCQKDLNSVLLDHKNNELHLYMKIASLQNSIAQQQMEQCGLQLQISSLQIQLKDTTFQKQTMEEELQVLYKNMHELEERCQHVQKQGNAEVEKLELELVAVKTKNETAMEDFKKKMDERQANWDKEMGQLRNVLTEREQANTKLNQQKEILQQQLKLRTQQHEKLIKQIQMTQKRLGLSTTEECINEYSLIEDMEKAIQAYRQDQDLLLKECAKRDTKDKMGWEGVTLLDRVEAVFKKLEADRNRVETNWDNFQNKLNSFLSTFLPTHIQSHNQQLIQQIQTQILLRQSELTAINTQIQGERNKWQQEKKNWDTDRMKLQREINNIVGKLKQQEVENLRGRDERKELTDRIEILENMLVKKEEKERDMMSRMQSQNQTIKSVYQQKLSETSTKLERQGKTLKNCLEQAKQQHLQLQSTVNSLREQLSAQKEQRTAIKRNYDNVMEQTNQLKKQVQQVRKQRDGLLMEGKDLRAQLQEISKRDLKMEEETKGVQQQIAELKSALNLKQRKLQQAENYLEDARTELETIQNKIISLANQTEASKTIATLDYAFEQLSATLTALSTVPSIPQSQQMPLSQSAQQIPSKKMQIFKAPCLYDMVMGELEWVVGEICGLRADSLWIETAFVRACEVKFDFKDLYGRTNILLVCQSDKKSIFMVMMSKISKSTDPVLLISPCNHLRYPQALPVAPSPQSKILTTPENRLGFVLGNNEILIQDNLKVTVSPKSNGYFGEIDVSTVFNLEAGEKVFNIKRMEIYEIVYLME